MLKVYNFYILKVSDMSNYYLTKNKKLALHFEDASITLKSPSSFHILFMFC